MFSVLTYEALSMLQVCCFLNELQKKMKPTIIGNHKIQDCISLRNAAHVYIYEYIYCYHTVDIHTLYPIPLRKCKSEEG